MRSPPSTPRATSAQQARAALNWLIRWYPRWLSSVVSAGTGLKRGDEFGGKHTVVGYECDGCQIEWRDGLPFPTHADGTPDTFEILGTAPAKWHPDDCQWYEKWENGRTGNAVLGIYQRSGTVITAGSTDWAHGLRGGDEIVERITRNVIEKLGR